MRLAFLEQYGSGTERDHSEVIRHGVHRMVLQFPSQAHNIISFFECIENGRSRY